MQSHFILSQIVINSFILKISVTLLHKWQFKNVSYYEVALQKGCHLWIISICRTEIFYFYP